MANLLAIIERVATEEAAEAEAIESGMEDHIELPASITAAAPSAQAPSAAEVQTAQQQNRPLVPPLAIPPSSEGAVVVVAAPGANSVGASSIASSLLPTAVRSSSGMVTHASSDRRRQQRAARRAELRCEAIALIQAASATDRVRVRMASPVEALLSALLRMERAWPLEAPRRSAST